MVEETDNEYLAYCDEPRAVASGFTEEEAVTNLKMAVSKLIEDLGPEARAEMARRKALAIEI